MDLVDFLIARSQLAPAQRERVRAVRAERGDSEPVILARLGLLPERDIAEALTVFLDLPSVRQWPQEPVLPGAIAPEFLARARILPLAAEADGIDLAMADPTDGFALDA